MLSSVIIERMRGLIAVALFAACVLVPVRAYAWECKNGVADTPENEANGMCVLPKKHHYEKPTATPVPTQVHAAPVPTIAPPLATQVPTATLPPAVIKGVAERREGEVCVFEETTGQWEIRQHTGDTLEAGQKWPMAQGLCEQERPAVPTVPPPPVLTTPVAGEHVAAPVAQPVETPQPEAVPPTVATVPACITGDLVPLLDENGDQVTVEGLPAWLIDESGNVLLGEQCPSVPDVPLALPETGDGSTAAEFAP